MMKTTIDKARETLRTAKKSVNEISQKIEDVVSNFDRISTALSTGNYSKALTDLRNAEIDNQKATDAVKRNLRDIEYVMRDIENMCKIIIKEVEEGKKKSEEDECRKREEEGRWAKRYERKYR
jgi:predicted S18 family serine protease